MLRKLYQRKIAIVMGASILVLAILFIDKFQVHLDRRSAQKVAEAAAYSAGLGKAWESQDYRSVAFHVAAINGYNNDGLTNIVQLYDPPKFGLYSGNKDYLQVEITSYVETPILHTTQEIKVFAVVHVSTTVEIVR